MWRTATRNLVFAVSVLAVLGVGCSRVENPRRDWQVRKLASLGFAALKAGKNEEAWSSCSDAWQLAPERDDLLLCMAAAAIARERHDLVVATVPSLLARGAGGPYPWLLGGLVVAHVKRGLGPESIPLDDVEGATADGLVYLLLSMGRTWGAWGQWGDRVAALAGQEAAGYWRRASKPFTAEVLTDMDCRAQEGPSASSESPASGWGLVHRAWCAGRNNEQEQALRLYQQAAKLRPDILVSHLNLALAHARAGRPREALDALRPLMEAGGSPLSGAASAVQGIIKGTGS